MAEVAKLLGVELDQEFTIENRCTSYIFMLTNQGLCSRLNTQTLWKRSLLLEDFITGCYQIQKLSKPILDPAEKRYLLNVIKPFRDKVISIAKYDIPGRDINCHYIQIKVNQDYHYEYISLPYFKSGKMYKGMKVNREYTLDQLEL